MDAPDRVSARDQDPPSSGVLIVDEVDQVALGTFQRLGVDGLLATEIFELRVAVACSHAYDKVGRPQLLAGFSHPARNPVLARQFSLQHFGDVGFLR